MEIKKVLKRKDRSGVVKYVIVPKDCDIQPGDYVVIEKFEENRGDSA